MPDAYQTWRAEMEPARAAAVTANMFNAKLAAYRKAITRLDRYRLADGREEISQEQQATDQQSPPVR